MTTKEQLTNRIRIFSNGSQFADWQASNCERCTKFSTSMLSATICDIDLGMAIAYIDDGTVSQEIATRAGYDPDRYIWPCDEVEWTDEWKAEYLKKDIV